MTGREFSLKRILSQGRVKAGRRSATSSAHDEPVAVNRKGSIVVQGYFNYHAYGLTPITLPYSLAVNSAVATRLIRRGHEVTFIRILNWPSSAVCLAPL